MEVEEVRAVFMSVVEAEERVKMMKAISRSGTFLPQTITALQGGETQTKEK